MNRILAPSLLSSDFMNLQSEIEMLNSSKAQWIHCDIMDGHFVPNLTFGPPVLKQMRKLTKKIMDVHLMISNAEQYLNDYVDAGADVLTLHWEAIIHLHRSLQTIKTRGVKAGVSLNPHTPVSVLEDILPMADLILLMSVNPGFGGQKFITGTIDKVKKLSSMRARLNPQCLIQVDGGISKENSDALFQAGANVLVAGNAVFGSADPRKEIELILKQV